ncbi:Methyltransferase domain-containing protein [Desulfoscipio geothermicus DSM 3669]|uniref:Methyltransferase domain-containing protein n=2 Tax=Desulfoscipio geothermicus TaxID=39060 RepID=A0A1I6EMT4_9FIRM|nr:Methyltransferase domain-containing protein [Desulfoscipio geothermicus DSM 3669]
MVISTLLIAHISFSNSTNGMASTFFIPLLKSGMNLLDCECGSGTITAGLAKVVAPGLVTGVDLELGQIEKARVYAQEQGISNISFRVASIYELPFPDETFDAVFIHALLQHLQTPLKALREINRVLKPGGIIGVRDDDQGGFILAPYSPQMERIIDFLKQFMRHNGGDPCVGRRHRELLRQAGFINVQASATCEYDGILEETQKRGNLAAKLLGQMIETVIDLGWASADEMEELADAARKWGEHPDAFDAIIWYEAVGWKV